MINILTYLIILVLIFGKIFGLDNVEKASYINTQNIKYNEVEGIVELGEGSQINFNRSIISMDKGIIDYPNDKFQIFGSYYLYQDKSILSGSNFEGNTDLTKFDSNNVSYIYNEDLKVDSEKMKRNENIIEFYDNFLTPCEISGYFGCPTWSFKISKTKYDIKNDKFVHYDSFLQIADYKIFYLPYFSHYGSDAPRKKGFLTPTLEFDLSGDSFIKTPYYIPLNNSTDLTVTPRINLSSLELNQNYQQTLDLNSRTSGGDINIQIYNELNNNNQIYSNSRLSANQTISKNSNIDLNIFLTNSVSNSRSINKNPKNYEEIFIKFNSYKNIDSNDYLIAELNTVEAYDNPNTSYVPATSSLTYSNSLDLKSLQLDNNLYVNLLNRDQSSIEFPSESKKISIKNSIGKVNIYENNIFYNKLILTNNINSYTFEHNNLLDREVFDSNFTLSSEINTFFDSRTKSKIKFILNTPIKENDNKINENSKAVTFNYHNLFSDNRFYGDDLADKSERIAYGLERDIKLNDINFNFMLGQMYDLKKNNSYLDAINQKENFSDYSLGINANYKKFNFNLDNRIDRTNLTKKELNYNINIDSIIKTKLNYNETKKNAFKELSADSKSLSLTLERKINNYSSVGIDTDLDLKNNYSPYSQNINFNLFDECSRLKIEYINNRYNDNFNTTPEEKISISFFMDYLGFIGYEQNTNLFFQDTGNFNYGL